VSNRALTRTIKTTYTAFWLYFIALDLQEVSYHLLHLVDHSCVPFYLCMYLSRDQSQIVKESWRVRLTATGS
jgi:hypothetical protein